MNDFPADFLALLALVFALGARHGLDPDHLATVDGLTRFNSGTSLARWCGFLFSLGHGAMVMAVALVVGLLARAWAVPPWLEDIGAWISILFLVLLGVLNLSAVLRAPAGRPVVAVGLLGRIFSRLQHVGHPALVALVGALFAFSFDTMSQAALFSITATSMGGWVYSLALGASFTLGMMVMDGINGLWVARMLRHGDRCACLASRFLCLTLAALSFLVAAFGAARYFMPAVAAWGEGREGVLGLAVVAVVAGSFALGLWLSRRGGAFA